MTPDHARPDATWTIIIPVKDTRVAKTRLSRLSQPVRAALALAFAMDSATAALECPAVLRVLVVTNDGDAGVALEAAGAHVIPDAPDSGLNAALTHGVSTVRREDPAAAVAAMSGDLPALRSEDLTVAFLAGSALPHWFVADAEGSGTTLLAAGPGTSLSPSFGARSRETHARLAAVEIVGPDLARLRRDVDTEEHLRKAVRLGVGRFTRAALADLELASSPRT
jgi:2-phospho-L-lactate/phosphoenolpyruvate guanylyltransferase